MNRIEVLIDVPEAMRPATAAFWGAALGWPLGPPEPGHPEYASFEPPDGVAYAHLQTLASAEDTPRVLVDLHVADLYAATSELAALGATAGRRWEGCQLMTSPGGLPFCLLGEPADRADKPENGSADRENPPPRPGPVRQPNGARSRLVQVCLDSAPERHETEIAFWGATTGWRPTPSDLPQFGGKLSGPPAAPVRLLFQRLGADAAGRPTRAHLDLGADDVEAEAGRLASLGAELVGSGPGWITLRDPAGLPFCVTAIDPT